MKTTIETTRFGKLHVNSSNIFKLDILGFPGTKYYALIESHAGQKYLQSTVDPSLCFFVDKPWNFSDRYFTTDSSYINLLDSEIQKVWEGYEMPCCFVIVTNEPNNVTANLVGPILLNYKDNTGIQAVDTLSTFTTREKYIMRD